MSDRMPKATYERELKRLQAQLVDMQAWVQSTGARIVVIFEGRDAAGKGSTISRVSQYLNPRVTRVVALPTPTEREKSEWYFQRYIAHLRGRRDRADGPVLVQPRRCRARDGVLHERGVPPVSAPGADLRADACGRRHPAEEVLVQRLGRRTGEAIPLPQRRPDATLEALPNDVLSITKWEDYSRAKDTMFVHTDIPESPWFEVDNEDKRRGRINMIHHLLSQIPYEEVERAPIAIPARPASGGYERPPRELQNYVPDYAATLIG
jgi:hypothetical protein